MRSTGNEELREGGVVKAIGLLDNNSSEDESRTMEGENSNAKAIMFRFGTIRF